MTIPSNATVSGNVAYTVDATPPYTITAWNMLAPNTPYLSQPFDPATGIAWASMAAATTWIQNNIASNQATAATRQALITGLTNLVNSMSAQQAQAQADLNTLSASADPLAPIVARAIQGDLEIASGVSDILSLLNLLG